jgi:cyanophycinase
MNKTLQAHYCRYVIVLVVATLPMCSLAATPAERLRPDGLVGTVLLANVSPIPDRLVEHFVDMAGGDDAQVVVVVARETPLSDEDEAKLLSPWENAEPDTVKLLYIATREQADDAERAEILHTATGVWLKDFDARQLLSIARGTRLAAELRELLHRKGALGVEGSASAALAADALLDGQSSDLTAGLNLLGQCVIDPSYDRESDGKRLREIIHDRPGWIGVGLPQDTTLEIRGRFMHTLNGGSASVVLPPGTNWHRETVALAERRIGDWNQLHRAARDRANPNYLPKEPAAPEVPHGALVIIGGGRTPPDVLARFIKLGGGADDGEFVVFPTAMPDPIVPGLDSRFLRRAGVKHVTELPARELKEVDSPENLALLKRATGVWFGGGRQWHFIDAYEGTKTAELLRDVLKRGGVIGGSSAGATIQGDYLVRGSPFGSEIMMCEGYERALGFLPGVAIDQHFSARDRFSDMTALMDKYPQFLGIGLDESTALVVQGHTAEIMGAGKVYFYDRRQVTADDDDDYDTASAGDKYDFRERKIIPAEKKSADKSVCP